MATFKKDRKQVDAALRKSGVVVVMNKNHIEKPEHMVTTMKLVYEEGFVAEVTFRIDEGIIREAMKELVKIRAGMPADKPFVLGIGSVINPKELEAAIDMGFDMIVAPSGVMGGYGEAKEFVKIAHTANVFTAPAVFTPTELNYWLERGDGLEPDALKVFPAGSHGPKGVADLLAPFARARHKNKIVMPTGAVNFDTGPEYIKAISGRGFTPVLGMSSPLKLVDDRKKPGDKDTVIESLKAFRAEWEKRIKV